jgi:hypothetical protein
MKKCPKCQADYFDEMLEFCLEDGAKLSVAGSRATAAETKAFNKDQKELETMFSGHGGEVPQTVEVRNPATVDQPAADRTEATVSLKEKAVAKGSRALEIGTLVFALAHNWWQWVYVDRQSYGSISNFLFSAEFLLWILLLFAGAACGLLTLKFSRKKELGYAGLVVLAINFLLLLVPKR